MANALRGMDVRAASEQLYRGLTRIPQLARFQIVSARIRLQGSAEARSAAMSSRFRGFFLDYRPSSFTPAHLGRGEKAR